MKITDYGLSGIVVVLDENMKIGKNVMDEILKLNLKYSIVNQAEVFEGFVVNRQLNRIDNDKKGKMSTLVNKGVIDKLWNLGEINSLENEKEIYDIANHGKIDSVANTGYIKFFYNYSGLVDGFSNSGIIDKLWVGNQMKQLNADGIIKELLIEGNLDTLHTNKNSSIPEIRLEYKSKINSWNGVPFQLPEYIWIEEGAKMPHELREYL